MKRNKPTRNDIEMIGSHEVWLRRYTAAVSSDEQRIVPGSALLFCEAGEMVLSVNFDSFHVRKGSVVMLFPNDVVSSTSPSADFSMLVLCYDVAILRSAALQLEDTIYSHLRLNRHIAADNPLSSVMTHAFAVLTEYFDWPDCLCLEQVVLLQLRSFFIGYNEYLRQLPAEPIDAGPSRRRSVLFDRFMLFVEAKHREMRDVQSYASLLNISPKYLNMIVRQMTGHGAKVIIDHFVTLQLKMELRKSSASIKEIARMYHFSDLSFLCRYFKQRTGMSPQAFRKTLG